MTRDLNVKSIAIIGAGFSGISTLADLLHTSEDGVSTLQSGKRPQRPAFDTIKVFEQTSRIGGAWNYSKATDPDFPHQSILETKEYWNPRDIIVQKKRKDDILEEEELVWSNSAVYDNMHTNIAGHVMQLTTSDPVEYPDRIFNPFLTHQETLDILVKYAKKYELEDFISFHSSVKNVLKGADGKYQLTIETKDPETGKSEWSVQTFDAIVVGSGRFQYPHIPLVPKLAEYNAKFPGVISHAKSFRNGADFEGKKIIIVGTSVSSIGILEYVKPVAKEIYISRRRWKKETDPKDHLDKALEDDGVSQVGEIIDFNLEDGSVIFKTGEIVSDIDAIIFATGFHIHYPFLDDLSKNPAQNIAKVQKYNGEQQTLVTNLYRYIFTIGEPTIAHVGIPSTPYFIRAVEAQGAAIAGVWSNFKRLPDINGQKNWEKERLEFSKKERVSHQFHPEVMIDEINHLSAYFPTNRPNPTIGLDPKVHEHEREIWEGIYSKFFSGEYPEDYVSKHDTSGF